MAERLGRNVQSIKDKRIKLGLKREKINNLKGKRFGRLLVLRENGRIRRRVAWLCRCDCGREIRVSSTNLIQHYTVSCGCYSRDAASIRNSKDLTGMKFNHLTAIKRVGRSNTYITWLCACDCGKSTEVSSTNLLTGNTESCGCRRKINQRKGLEWELLVKKMLHYKYLNFMYHKRLPNNSLPDFIVEHLNIILDAKRHDYLKIEECLEKYSAYCEKIIFICMEKKRKNWKMDYKNRNDIEFWYLDDILEWIPEKEQEYFFNEVERIKNIWIKEKDKDKEIIIEKTVEMLEKEEKKITQVTIAKKLGISKKTLRNDTNVKTYLENYRNDQKEKEEEEMIENLKIIIDDKILKGKRIMVQDVAREILKSQKKQEEEITEQKVWALTKKLSTNRKYIEHIEKEKSRLEESRKETIRSIIKELKAHKENITVFKIRTLTGLPKNYLYSEEIKNYIDSIQ